jgi:Protein of unknown function (DUF5661)
VVSAGRIYSHGQQVLLTSTTPDKAIGIELRDERYDRLVIGVNWSRSRFDVEQFRMGLEIELEHGRRDPATNVSDDDELTTGKIARAFPDYYTRLAQMEAEAQRYWAERA